MEIVKIGKKTFRYDRNRAVVQYVTKASEEDLAEEAEWIEKHGCPLFGIDADGFIVLDSVGLSRENWDDRTARLEYLTGWSDELDEEAAWLVAEFVRYELPALQKSGEVK